MASQLKGKVILVSGASGGLGESVTQAFLDAGGLVAGVSRQWPPEASNTPGFLPVSADLTQEPGCSAAVRATLEQWSRLDAAVHLMGGFAGGNPAEATPVEEWDRMMSLNLRSAFLFFRAALPPMLKAGRGRLLAVGSRPGLDPVAGLSAYAASKAGLHALIRTLAAENRDRGITANAVLPSVIDTPANRSAMPKADTSKWVPPESIAALLVFLAGDAAQDISGALVPIYGRS
jgi:NAD(P)-dependent dehydrogenase (short-subunit alcohol dehydrogenase family)